MTELLTDALDAILDALARGDAELADAIAEALETAPDSFAAFAEGVPGTNPPFEGAVYDEKTHRYRKPDSGGDGDKPDAPKDAGGTDDGVQAKHTRPGEVDVGELVGKVVDAAVRTTRDVASSRVVASLGRAGAWLVDQTKKAFKKLEKRYGKAGAAAIAASSQVISWGAFLGGPALVGIPIYIPSAVAAAPGAAVAEVVKLVKGKGGERQMSDGELSPQDAERLAKEFVAEVEALWAQVAGDGWRESKPADDAA